MEYTRSTGEHCYETFEGTPEEIAKLINAIDGLEGNAEVVHEPRPITRKEIPVIGAAFDKIVGYECSCGDENCELYKAERG